MAGGVGDFLKDLYGEPAPSRKAIGSSVDRLNEALDAYTRAREAVLQSQPAQQAGMPPASGNSDPRRIAAELPETSMRLLGLLRVGGPQPFQTLIERSGLESGAFLDAIIPVRSLGLVHSFTTEHGDLFELTPEGLAVAQQAPPLS